MANIPTPEQAVELAQRAQEDRIAAVRELAYTRNALETTKKSEAAARDALEQEYKQRRKALEDELKNQAKSTKQADVKAYRAALRAGWSEDELKRIGFPKPNAQRNKKRRAHAPTNTTAHTPGDANNE